MTAAAIEGFEDLKRERLQLALYRLKNNYVMNNNGARNFALRAGRWRAKWVLPFDGNCFFSSEGWRQVRNAVTTAPQLKYYVVPMARVPSNADLLDDGFAPDPQEEPQVLFRKDAQEELNEAFCYGRRPKVELLWRLGVPGKWDAYRDDAWDQKRAPLALEARQYGVAGWVARLSSGMAHLEVQSTAGADSRYLSRAEAILTTLRSLDASLGASPAAPAISPPTPAEPREQTAKEDDSIVVVDVAALDRLDHSDPQGVAVVMPSIDTGRAREAARLLVRRAGMATTVFVVEDTVRQGFIPTLNAAAAKLDVKYLVYLAEDAFPGVDWLRVAHDALESSGKSLLAFNDGKWQGRIAAYGMVRLDWVRTLYGGPVFHPGYRAHKADNELTVIARLRDTFVYEPNATLIEYDPHKIFTDKIKADRTLFRERFRNGFDGLVDRADVVPLAAEYFVPLDAPEAPTRHSPAVGLDSLALTCLRADCLDREVGERDRDPALKAVVERLLGDAETALGRGLHSVTDKTTLPPSGNSRDYWHPAPYWWPNPATRDGLPFVRRDGHRVPGTRMYEPESDKYDRTRLQHVFDDSFVLALAWKFSGERRYIEHAARILERFFVDPHTAITPHLTYAQVRMGHAGNLGTSTGIIEMKDLYYYLDAVRIMQAAGAVSDDSIAAFKAWLKAYLDWLLTSPQGTGERAASNNHGSYYDLQVGAIAAFLGERTVLFDTLTRARSRIARHFEPDGSQPHELARNTSAHYCCFNFQGWIHLAELARRWNIDLWSYRSETGASLEQGARWLLGHMGRPWPYEQIDEFDTERFHPVLFALPSGVTVTTDPPGTPASRYHAKPRFFPHDGIRPYWNLGSAVAQDTATGTPADTPEMEPVR